MAEHVPPPQPERLIDQIQRTLGELRVVDPDQPLGILRHADDSPQARKYDLARASGRAGE